MTNKLRTRSSVDRIDTDTDRTPLLAGTPTPTASNSSRSLSPDYNTTQSTTQTITNDFNDDDAATDDGAADHHPSPANHLRAVLRPRVILLSLVLVFLIELAIGMTTPPVNAIMESIICRQKHPELFPPQDNDISLPAPPAIPIPPTEPDQPVPPTDPDPDQPTAPLPPLTPLTHRTLPTLPTTPRQADASSASAETTSKFHRIAGGVILIDDPACKAADVQGYLAMLRGWANTFESFPGIIGAVPYGILSDRWGRRPVLALGIVGCVVSVGFTYGVCEFFEPLFVCCWVVGLGVGVWWLGMVC